VGYSHDRGISSRGPHPSQRVQEGGNLGKRAKVVAAEQAQTCGSCGSIPGPAPGSCHHLLVRKRVAVPQACHPLFLACPQGAAHLNSTMLKPTSTLLCFSPIASLSLSLRHCMVTHPMTTTPSRHAYHPAGVLRRLARSARAASATWLCCHLANKLRRRRSTWRHMQPPQR